MAHQILVRIDVDEEYKDVDPQIAADDYMEGSKAYGWEVITERVYTHSEVEAMLREMEEDYHDERSRRQFVSIAERHGVIM